jgi:spore coat polysaccharide biosynthesis protein SpsF
MRTVAILQARMTSTRLPGKVLMDLCGEPMLGFELRRLLACGTIDEVVVATTVNAEDDPVVACAERVGVRWFRGSEHDVLSRYVAVAAETQADVVVRVTADCPFLDPAVVDRVVGSLEPGDDYASNMILRTYPHGLDTEVLWRDTLERVGRLGSSPDAREHVTWFLRFERPDLFVLRSVTQDGGRDDSDLRWTVDLQEDLERARRLCNALGLAGEMVPFERVVDYHRAHDVG